MVQNSWFCFVFTGPRWRPGLPFFGILQRIPIREKEPHPEIIYNPMVPLWMKVYATLHFLAVLPFFFAMLASFERGEPRWSAIEIIVTFVHVVLTLGQVGSVFDGRDWVPLSETVRCGFLAMIFTSLPGFDREEQDERLISGMRVLFIASMCFWPIIALLPKMSNTDEKAKWFSLLNKILIKVNVRGMHPNFTHPVFRANFAHSCLTLFAGCAVFTSNMTC